MTFHMLGLERKGPGAQGESSLLGKTEAAFFQSNPKEPVVSTKLIKNRGCQLGCSAATPRSETTSSKPGSFKLFICLHFSSFAIDLQGPFLRTSPHACLAR